MCAWRMRILIGHQCMETAMSTDSEFGGGQRRRRERVRNCRILQIGDVCHFLSVTKKGYGTAVC